MKLISYKLTDTEKERLRQGVKAALAIPLIDSIEDFIWEGVFCYTKNVDFVDPLTGVRSKRLFDIVDTKTGIGWSAKALQWNMKIGGEFELVIQRADVLKKRETLGFPDLNLNSPPDYIGMALIKHWQNKVNEDAMIQSVQDKRVCILLKNVACNRFAYFEEELAMYHPSDLTWRWTDSTKTGLQGIRKSDNFCVYRWYPNQKQFFERFKFDEQNFIFGIDPKRIDINVIIDFLTMNL